ncbi:7002_t:CDS:2 [Funneliformis geosporum]|uniref:7002_t:CDS:1 n=1 Tax=Funneliformis geosporum TaxID=1117311 RepID=A0A9W4WVP9_9GLOM|nr:7002_t:CDS:2 [Funneliformis geosporum]
MSSLFYDSKTQPTQRFITGLLGFKGVIFEFRGIPSSRFKENN